MNGIGTWNLVSYLIDQLGVGGTPAATAITIGGILLCVIVPYLLGSLNFGVMISQRHYRDDVRTHGSGNAGATNMLRTYGKKAAILTFLVDFLKGVAACLIAMLLVTLIKGGSAIAKDIAVTAAGMGAILGHNWPLYFGFKGGKGVLTSFAIMLFIVPVPTLIAFVLFIVIVAITRYVSLGSIIAAASLPVMVFFAGDVLAKSAGSGLSVQFVFCVVNNIANRSARNCG